MTLVDWEHSKKNQWTTHWFKTEDMSEESAHVSDELLSTLSPKEKYKYKDYLAIRETHRKGGEHTEETRLSRNSCCVYMRWNNIWWTAVLAPATTQKAFDKFKPRQVLNWLQRPTTAENKRLKTTSNWDIYNTPLLPKSQGSFPKGHKGFQSQMWSMTRNRCFPDIAGKLHIRTHSMYKTKPQHEAREVGRKVHS